MTAEKLNRYIFQCWKWGTPLVFWAKTEEEARKEYEYKLGRPPGHVFKGG